VSAHVVSGQSKDTRRVLQLGHEPSQDALDMMKELAEDRVRRFGSDITIKSSGLDEECERELENASVSLNARRSVNALAAPPMHRVRGTSMSSSSRSIRANSRCTASCSSTRR
jgi:hypothetical protein